MKQIKNSQEGFTIIESVMATAILMIVMGAIVFLLIFTNQVGSSYKTRLQASNLLNEQLELIRNARDNSWLSKSKWDEKLDPQFFPNKTVKLDEFDYVIKSEFTSISNNEKSIIVTVLLKNAEKEMQIAKASTKLTNWR